MKNSPRLSGEKCICVEVRAEEKAGKTLTGEADRERLVENYQNNEKFSLCFSLPLIVYFRLLVERENIFWASPANRGKKGQKCSFFIAPTTESLEYSKNNNFPFVGFSYVISSTASAIIFRGVSLREAPLLRRTGHLALNEINPFRLRPTLRASACRAVISIHSLKTSICRMFLLVKNEQIPEII